MALYYSSLIFLEIAGECCTADDIGAAVVVADIFQMGRSVHDQLFADGKRYQACVLADDKQVENIIFRGGLFYQILVSKGEGVGIHDQGGGLFALLLFLCQPV